MDKFLQKINSLKKTVCFSILFGFSFFSGAQTPSFVENIRFPVWAEVDAYPGLAIPENQEEFGEECSYAIGRITEIVPFLVNGMVYGWKFVYVPSDKARGVEEYFEIQEIQSEDLVKNGIKYSETWIEDGKLNCWVDYKRTQDQIQLYKLWSSIENPAIQGRGYGKIEDGFDGIKKASEDALKNAVRDYYRKMIKNKPKEITGSVLIRRAPLLGIDSGRYAINLDFFLEYGRIKMYTQF